MVQVDMSMSIIDNVKDLAKLAQEFGKIELYQKAVDLMSQVTELAHENFELKHELADLKQRNEIGGSLLFVRNVYWRKIDGKMEGPFCSCCWDAEGKLMRLQQRPMFGPTCPICKVEIMDNLEPPST